MAIRLDWSNIGQGLKDVAGTIHERRYQREADELRRRRDQIPDEVEAGQWYDFYDQTGVGPAAPPQYVPTDGAAPETPQGLTRQATADMQYRAPGAEQMYGTREEAAAAMPSMSRSQEMYELAEIADRNRQTDRAKEYRTMAYQYENMESLSALRDLQMDAARMELESAQFAQGVTAAARNGLTGVVDFANQKLNLGLQPSVSDDGYTILRPDGAPLFPPVASEAEAVELVSSWVSNPQGFAAILQEKSNATLAAMSKSREELDKLAKAQASRLEAVEKVLEKGLTPGGAKLSKQEIAEYVAERDSLRTEVAFINQSLTESNAAWQAGMANALGGVPFTTVQLYVDADEESRRELETRFGAPVMRQAEARYQQAKESGMIPESEEGPAPVSTDAAGLTYSSELVDPEASAARQFQQRSQATGRVNEMRRSIVQKLAETKPSRGLPGFTDQPTLRERERVNTIIEWYQSPAAERLFIENPDLINPAFSDPEGFYREYGGQAAPGMKNGGLVRGYKRGGKVTDDDIARYNSMIDEIAPQYGVDPDFMRRLVDAESSYNPRAKSGAGAMGLGQLMPGTAKDMGVKDPYDPEQNLHGAAKYLGWLQGRHDNPAEVLAAYNAGTGRVREKGFDWVYENYPETRDYVNKILPDFAESRRPRVTGQTPSQAQAGGLTQPPRTDITLPPGAPAPMGPRTGRTPSQMPDRGGLRGAVERGSSYLGEETDTRENRRRIEKDEAPLTRGDYLQRAGDALSRGSRRPAYVEPERFSYDPLGSGAAMETLERSRVRGPQFGLAMARGGQVRDYRDGGDVNGPGTATSDSIPARLSDGEYVINADAVALPGVEELLEYINNLGLQIRDLDQQRRA
jgi:hypothetical protein